MDKFNQSKIDNNVILIPINHHKRRNSFKGSLDKISNLTTQKLTVESFSNDNNNIKNNYIINNNTNDSEFNFTDNS